MRLLIGLLIVISVFTSCTPINGSSHEIGTISITLLAPQSRGLTNQDAALYSDTYEVFAYSPADTISYNVLVTPNNTAFLEVPIGTYNVIALAGWCGGNSSAGLLGSGKASDIVVSSGNVASVSITLQSIIVGFSVPSSVTVGTTYTITATFDSRISEIQLDSTSLTSSAGIAGTGYTGSTWSSLSPTVSQQGTAYSYSYIFTANSTPVDATAYFPAGPISIIDESFNISFWTGFHGFNRQWLMYNQSNIPSLTPDIRKPISFVAATIGTGLSITIGWGT